MLQRKQARSPSASSTSRRARRARTTSPDRALTIELPNQKAPLPGDLAYIISAQVVGDFLQDIILDPRNASKEDVLGTMLHVSRTFREFTIRFLRLLWGNTFFDGEKMVLTNYKPSVSMLRKIAMIPYGGSRESLAQKEPTCVILDVARYYVERILSKYSRTLIGSGHVNLEFEYPHLEEVDLKILATYRTISPTLRPFLLGRVWYENVKLARLRQRARYLFCVVIQLNFYLSKATVISGLKPVNNWPAYTAPQPQELLVNEIRTFFDSTSEMLRPLLKVSDEIFASFLDAEDALDRLPTLTVQDFLPDELVSNALSLIEVLSNDPKVRKYSPGLVRLAKQCIGMFLTEDEEARFVGPVVTKRKRWATGNAKRAGHYLPGGGVFGF